MARRPRTSSWKGSGWRGVSLAAVAILVLAACSPGDDGAADPAAPDDDAVPDRLTVLEWAGYELEEFYPAFTERYPDVDIDFQFGDSDADFLTAVQAGGVRPDVVHPCSGWVGLWQGAGLAQPIDTSLLTHWESLDPAMRDLGTFDGEPYFVPFDWGYTSIAVATERVDRVPTSWRDLWDPEYQGRIAIWDDPEEAVVTTAYAWGLDPYAMTDEDLDVVRDRLRELHQQTRSYWTASFEVNQLLIDGEVDLAQAWTETYAAMLDAGIEAEYVDPEEGRLGWVCGFIVTAEPGTPEYRLAHEYIDATMAPEAGQYLVDEYYYGHANLDTIEVADPEVVSLIELDDLEIRERTNFYEPLTEEQRETWSRIWAEVTAG
jgi:spermidine/putrescine transport system substrate-binding protein